MAGAEVLTGLGVACYALFTGRDIPSEQKLKLSESARRFCGITAPGTLKAAGPILAENPEIVTWASPVFFGGTVALHLLRGILDVRAQEPRKQRPKPVAHEVVAQRAAPAPAAPADTPEPIPDPSALRMPSIPPIPPPGVPS